MSIPYPDKIDPSENDNEEDDGDDDDDDDDDSDTSSQKSLAVKMIEHRLCLSIYTSFFARENGSNEVTINQSACSI